MFTWQTRDTATLLEVLNQKNVSSKCFSSSYSSSLSAGYLFRCTIYYKKSIRVSMSKLHIYPLTHFHVKRSSSYCYLLTLVSLHEKLLLSGHAFASTHATLTHMHSPFIYGNTYAYFSTVITSLSLSPLYRYRYINLIWFACHLLAMSNSCINPFIYALCSVSYCPLFHFSIVSLFNLFVSVSLMVLLITLFTAESSHCATGQIQFTAKGSLQTPLLLPLLSKWLEKQIWFTWM